MESCLIKSLSNKALKDNFENWTSKNEHFKLDIKGWTLQIEHQ